MANKMDYVITALRVDESGYYRDQNNYLVHRTMAFRLVYLPNRQKYTQMFKVYQVHHKDGNKLNNLPDNLLILTKDEHNFLHWICSSCSRMKICMKKYDHGYKCPKGYPVTAWKKEKEYVTD